MNTKALVILLASVYMLLFQVGCSSLEKPNVPIFVSIRLDNQVTKDQRMRDLERLRELGVAGVTLELPLEYHIEGQDTQPKVNRFARSQLSEYLPYLQQQGLAYNLMFPYLNLRSLFPGEVAPAPGQWLNALGDEIRAVLARCETIQPQRVIVAVDLQVYEAAAEQWKALFASLRPYTQAKLSYAASIERVSQVSFWAHSDEIALKYEPHPTQEYKIQAQRWHPVADSVALATGKPVFIAAANIMMDSKLTQLQNQLRFWSDEAGPAGLNLNTLYAISPLSDTTHYFGWANDAKALDWLSGYIRRSNSSAQ
jgi:hypothetical protein